MVKVLGHNNVALQVTTAGDPANPAILLIHGWSQSALSWARQLGSDLAERYFLIAPDLRGHGMSDKPGAAEAYNCSEPWAGDIQAIIDHFALTRPILAGWSLGGKLLLDYLRVHGDGNLAGVAHVNSAVSSGSFTPQAALAQRGAPDVVAEGMYSDDLATNVAATLAFVKACTAAPLPGDELATMMGFNMLCPPHVRRAARIRDADYTPDAAKTTVPALITWGDQEKIMPRALFDQACESFANPEPTVFKGSGHAPFWEDPKRFNSILSDFAERCFA